MAGNFNNVTGSNKFIGQFTYKDFNYEYILYLPNNHKPIIRSSYRKKVKAIPEEPEIVVPQFVNPEEREEVIRIFGNRMQLKDGITTQCLEIDEETVANYIDNNQVSAYVIVNQTGNDETASGTLQIYDWCTNKKRKRDDTTKPGVWINDVCRILGTKPKLAISPVDALFFVMEQLTVQNMNQTNISLFVDTTSTTNKVKLKEIYGEKGFEQNRGKGL